MTTEVATLYCHGSEQPCTSSYLSPLVRAICRKHGVTRVLDIGCGNGSLCRTLAAAGCTVVGMEPSRSGVTLARAAVPEGVFYEIGVYDDPTSVPEKDFDAVVSTEVVEHLVRPSALPEFASAKLKTCGILVVSTPYHGYLKNLLLSLLNQWDEHHTSLWDGGHIKFWSRRNLASLLTAHGFHVLEFHGVGRVRWLWKSMILVARKIDPAQADEQH